MTPKPRSIISLLNDVKNGNVALPDLQREFVWSEPQIRLLLDSIMRGYPFGLSGRRSSLKLSSGSS